MTFIQMTFQKKVEENFITTLFAIQMMSCFTPFQTKKGKNQIVIILQPKVNVVGLPQTSNDIITLSSKVKLQVAWDDDDRHQPPTLQAGDPICQAKERRQIQHHTCLLLNC